MEVEMAPDNADNPNPPDDLCDPIWAEITEYKRVKDWKPEMGGFGKLGGIGFVPDGSHWDVMGFDDSMHAVPEPSTLVLAVLGLVGFMSFARRKNLR